MKKGMLIFALVTLFTLGFKNANAIPPAMGSIELHQMTAAQGGGYRWFVNGIDCGPCTTSYIPSYVWNYALTNP